MTTCLIGDKQDREFAFRKQVQSDVMWTNRIAPFVNRITDHATQAPSPAACSLDVPPGAFVAPPTAGFQPTIYELARQQALYELKRRRRAAHVGTN